MNRKKQELSSVRISDEEYSRLENKFEALRNEFTACKRKLDSKCEALLILSKELDQCRSERDQFKLMAEQLRERYQSIKKQISGQPIASNSDTRLYKKYSDTQSQNLAKLLCDSRDSSKSLKFEVEDLKQKLHDAQGDIKLLREQIARQRVGTTDEGMNTRHFPAHEREELVQKLESSKDQYLQLERDLQTVLDEKEELVSERDVYKTKYERLNQELNYILKGDENRVVDIDALVMENKYLQERLKQMEEEQSMAMAAVSKYKSLLEKKKNKGCMKLGQSRGGGLIITQKQVQQVLETQSTVMASPQAMSDLQALAGALLDSMNDKNLALSHQRKTNKILGSRVAELEKKLKTLEVAGLWSVPSEVSASLEKLRQECDNVKTLIPRQSSDAGESEKMSDGDKDSELGTVTPLDSPFTTPEPSPTHSSRPLGHLELEDLDLLPTKEVSSIPGVPHDRDNLTYDVKNPVSNYVYDIPKFTSADLLGLPETYSTEEVNIPKNDLVASDNNYASNVHETDNIMHIHGEAEDANVFETSETDNLLKHDTKNMNIHESDMTRDMHVYNEDLVDESDEKINGDELELDGDALNETEQFYSTESKSIIKSTASRKDIPNKDSEETDDEDAETSEKISLLMENMTQKMCSISHDVYNNDHVASVSKSAVSSAGEGEVRNGQDLPLRPHDTQKVEDGPKDVEC